MEKIISLVIILPDSYEIFLSIPKTSRHLYFIYSYIYMYKCMYIISKYKYIACEPS